MSSYLKVRSTPRQFRPMLASCLQRPGLPFADALPEEAVYTPAMTLWAFLSQVLFKGERLMWHRFSNRCVLCGIGFQPVDRLAILVLEVREKRRFRPVAGRLPTFSFCAPLTWQPWLSGRWRRRHVGAKARRHEADGARNMRFLSRRRSFDCQRAAGR